MAVNDLDLTVIGWVGSDPRHYPAHEDHVAFTQFRLGSTRRVLDRDQGVYVDGRTVWFTVKVFRGAATNVSESVRRGDPVVVHGRLEIDDWQNADGLTRSTPVIVAAAVGHDLGRGTTRFVRTVRSSPTERDEQPVGTDGAGGADDADGRAPGDRGLGSGGERPGASGLGLRAGRLGPGAGGLRDRAGGLGLDAGPLGGDVPSSDLGDRPPVDVTGAAVLDDDAAVRLAR